ncbi:hypothetical protein Tsubulata_051458, partial [Turnera subulata]
VSSSFYGHAYKAVKDTHKAENAVVESEFEELEEEEEENGGWDDWIKEKEGGEDDSDLLCLFCDTKYASSARRGVRPHCLSIHKFDFHGVAEDKSWGFEHACNSSQFNPSDTTLLWNDLKYLKPFLLDDTLLYSNALVEKEDVLMDLGNIEGIYFQEENVGQGHASTFSKLVENRTKEAPSTSNGTVANEVFESPKGKLADTDSKGSTLMLPRKDIKKANENYFGAYSSFGIHREMIRMDAYRQAILQNPSLLTGAVVMDVGCGTGILSLFSAQAGASRVIAVEASQKMAAVATQIAKDNGLWRVNAQTNTGNQCGGIIEVVQSMVEGIDKSVKIEPHSIDVLLSEWMGYCLLYESMLSSVLFARDKWWMPGGAILPDTATITFDLVTMRHDEVSIELEPKPGMESKTTWCYGIVLWFDTGFTTRFCKEAPAVSSTSPYTPKTHWSQTILTFQEPIAMAFGRHSADRSAVVGTDACLLQGFVTALAFPVHPNIAALTFHLKQLRLALMVEKGVGQCRCLIS